jgi:hypothetical protein
VATDHRLVVADDGLNALEQFMLESIRLAISMQVDAAVEHDGLDIELARITTRCRE